MKVTSDRFGELDLREEDLLFLEGGLIGFPGCDRVAILEHGPGSPFRWLLSVDDPSLAFVVTDPVVVAPDYPLEALRDRLFDDGRRPAQVVVAAITTVPADGREITLNLMAPVVFDPETRHGRQVVLHDGGYGARHSIPLGKPRDP